MYTHGPGPELMAFSKKKKREKNGGASLKAKGRGKLVELLGDHITVFPPPQTYTCIHALACCRVADRVPFLFFFSTKFFFTSTEKRFFFCWSV